MRNLWIQTENPFATWVANLDAQRGAPAALVRFVTAVLRAGAAERIFDVVSAPLINHERERDADLAGRLEELHREQGIVDLFGFTGAAMAPGAPRSSTVEAVLAWYDSGDQLVEGPCADLGALLASLEPAPDSIPNGFKQHYPPVRVVGHRLDYAVGSEPRNLPARRPLEVRFAIHSDIWFPWIFGSAHPEADHRRMFDNRALAERHAPRLNAFLRAVAAEVRSLGGRWYVDPDETGRNAISWLDEGGLHLDAPPPSDVFPASALDAEWY